jgi:hypothetical protein
MKKNKVLLTVLSITVFSIISTGHCVSAENVNNEVNDQQITPPRTPVNESSSSPEQPEVINLGNGRFQIGKIIVDEDKKEVTIPGHLNMVEGPIEFIACTKGGMKEYESVLEMDTDAKSFNLSMILLGLDPKKGKAAAYHFDPSPPEGDLVEIFIRWNTPLGIEMNIKAQDLIYDMNTNRTFSVDNWVYTGSVFLEDGRYLAEEAGVLIGFVHDPASIIESHYSGKFPAFGSFVVNKNYLDKVGTKIQMIIRLIKIQEAGNKTPEHERTDN